MSGLRRCAQWMFQAGGGVRAVRFRRRHELRILMYHRFWYAARDVRQQIEQQCAHLSRAYHTLSLTEAARLLAAGDPLPPYSLVITIDDGHRDFYTGAYPVFKRYGLKATLYLTTGFMDGECWLWPDEVDYFFRETRRPRVELEFAGRAFPLETAEQRLDCAEVVKQGILTLPNAERLRLLETLARDLGVERRRVPPEEWAALGWEEVREMAASGMEFGGHTRTHPILSQLDSDETLETELAGSKRRLEEALDTEVAHFCYPNGRTEDISSRVVEYVGRAGYRTAVLAEPGLISPGAPPLLLKRVPVDSTYEIDMYQRVVAGFRI
jgi:peptidoglycan/xylan/chitin deacetylase (PgdA/CDA1 family)